MIRNICAAIANAYERIWCPTPEPFPMRLSMVHPILLPKLPSPTGNPPPAYPPKRFYRVRDGDNPVHLIAVAVNDLMAYPHTRDALIPALKGYGPLHAHTVVIETPHWIGEFTIDANDNTECINLLLVEGADVAQPQQMDERGSPPAWA